MLVNLFKIWRKISLLEIPLGEKLTILSSRRGGTNGKQLYNKNRIPFYASAITCNSDTAYASEKTA